MILGVLWIAFSVILIAIVRPDNEPQVLILYFLLHYSMVLGLFKWASEGSPKVVPFLGLCFMAFWLHFGVQKPEMEPGGIKR